MRSPAKPERYERPRRVGERVVLWLGASSRFVPVIGVLTIVLATITVIVEGATVPLSLAGNQAIRGALYVLASFVGSYMPVPGQPNSPSLLGATVLLLALVTTLSGVTLAVLRVFAREIDATIAVLRSQCIVVIGDTAYARTFAARLRSGARPLVTVGADDHAMIRIIERADIPRDPRVRRAVARAVAIFVFFDSSVDSALTASEIRQLPGRSKTFQTFDWEMDRLVFRDAIRSGAFPRNEVFSPLEITGIHVAQLIAHVVRMRGDVLRVCARGDHAVLEIMRERLVFMGGVLAFRGAIEFVDAPEDADVVVLGVSQHEYVAAVDECLAKDRIVFVIAPERYFAAVGRADLSAVSSSDWLSERDIDGSIAWAGRVVLIDEVRIGTEIDELWLGIRGRWAREFHNAHSDFGAVGAAVGGFPNRWLDRAPHPRLVALANAAVDLMLRDLNDLGYELLVREGAHDQLSEQEVELCARHIHEQYLELTWCDDRGVERRCAQYFVGRDGELGVATPPPAWEEDTEQGRQRNRAMVREVYPALTAIFGYRITRSSLSRARDATES